MTLAVPALDALDHLPDAQAVWRDGVPPAGDASRRISVEYAGGIVARTYVGSVPDWSRVERWRWGWAGR